MSRKAVLALVILAVVVLSVVVLVLVPVTGEVGAGTDAVAVVRLAGPIQDSVSPSLFGGGAITPDLLRDRLELAEESPRVKAVVVRLDTPGGAVAASQEMAGMVREFPKPLVISMGDLAASGGYYVSSQADRIVAQPGTLTGSIGVIWATSDVEGLLDKLGVEIEAVTAGEHKDMFLPGRLTPERRRILQQMVDTMYDQFVSTVAEGRELEEDRVRELATGQLYTGERALDLELVDVLGGLDEAVDEAESLAGIEDAEVVELTPTFFEQLFSGPGLGELRLLLGNAVLPEEVILLREFLNGYLIPRY
ncbi:MAG: signal peptide peptidase SppA [Actinomycetota bacterium]|nr:signal peptide peptidase SppA [Actinomycetota bacterium]